MQLKGIDPRDLGQAGWGIVFVEGGDPAIRAALEPLLDLRRDQAYDAYHDQYEYRPGETKSAFLARYDVRPGPVDPNSMPYYLLLAGSPREIPFAFQQQLAIQRAVGRLDFDTPAEYASYAQSVVRAERNLQPQRAMFFGAQNLGDAHTALVSQYFMQPLAGRLQSQGRWDVDLMLGEAARKANLVSLLREGGHPTLMLLTGHGLGYPAGHPLQRARQGALICQDWPGPVPPGPVADEWCISADDIPPEADLSGLVWLQFSSFSLGTDAADGGAPEAFSSRLAQRLLALPSGGALAVVGLVGPSWSYASAGDTGSTRLALYQESLDRLSRGDSVGVAFEPIRQRFAERATELSAELEEVQFGKPKDDERLIGLWTSRNDASSLVIMGDPAARLTTIAGADESSSGNIKMNYGNVIKSTYIQGNIVVGGDYISGDKIIAPSASPADLKASLEMRLARLPSLLWPYLALDTQPLATLRVNNSNYDYSARLRITAEIPGYSAPQERLMLIGPSSQETVDLFPPPLPEALGRLSKPNRALLKVSIEEQETGRSVLEDERQIWLMETESFPLAVRDPTTAAWRDFSLYLGKFITPNAPEVAQLLKAAARIGPEGRLAGMEGEIEPQVTAIDFAVREDFGVRLDDTGQMSRSSESVTLPTPRLPAQVLSARRANRLEHALLFVSALEAAGLNAAIFIADSYLVPAWDDDGWKYLDPKQSPLGFAARVAAAQGVVTAQRRKRTRPGEFAAFLLVELAAISQAGRRA